MEQIFIQIAAILFVAFITSYIVRSLKQPLIIGYILAGIIISPFIIKFGASTEVINVFSKIGIAFLLFIVGLHLNPRIIKEIGGPSLLIGLSQMILTSGLGFLLSYYLLGFEIITSLYIAVALAFSSTIIVTKFLSDKQQLDSLHGKLSVGILMIQDLVAVLVLMFISSIGENQSGIGAVIFQNLLVGGLLIAGIFLIGYFVIPSLTRAAAKSQELLFLFSICWCFAIAALFTYFGFSIEIGALLAGVILSISPFSTEMSSKIRPLQDFFLIIFFIILGLNLKVNIISEVLPIALILSFFILIFKPLVLMVFSAMFKYTKRTNFLVGTFLSQISEFSIIVLALGVSLGHISQNILAILTLTLVITSIFSSYAISYSNKIYRNTFRFLNLFERKKIKKERRRYNRNYESILFGYNRTGFDILKSFNKMKKPYLVVDFNPDTIMSLKKFKIPCIYGDVHDPEFLNELKLDKTDLIVSTIPDFETNLLLIETIRVENPEAIVIMRVRKIEDALKLYRKGADYVVISAFLGGEFVSKMVKDLKVNKKNYAKERKKHIKKLKDVLKNSKGSLSANASEKHRKI